MCRGLAVTFHFDWTRPGARGHGANGTARGAGDGDREDGALTGGMKSPTSSSNWIALRLHCAVSFVDTRGDSSTATGTPSMRTRHLGLDDPTADPASTQAASVSGEGARISGIQRPEFPEPTHLASAGWLAPPVSRTRRPSRRSARACSSPAGRANLHNKRKRTIFASGAEQLAQPAQVSKRGAFQKDPREFGSCSPV